VDASRTTARAAAIVAGAAALAAADLALKAAVATPSAYQHARSPAWAALSLALLAACIAAARVDSSLLAVASGVTAGGVCGNGVSWLVHDGSVPDPLFVDFGGGIAFNLADAFVVAGLLAQVAALAHYAGRRHAKRSAADG
jgi:lipoprotein signal peptidase